MESFLCLEFFGLLFVAAITFFTHNKNEMEWHHRFIFLFVCFTLGSLIGTGIGYLL